MDPLTQKKKREILKNDAKVRATYRDFAQSDPELELGGRFAKVTPSTVVGAAPVTSVPRQPEGSHWHSDPMPMEPPLGLDINAVEPVGEPHELRASEQVAATNSEPATSSEPRISVRLRRRI
jgi:hypothetical protein